MAPWRNGRRRGLKIPRSRDHVGSSPTGATSRNHAASAIGEGSKSEPLAAGVSQKASQIDPIEAALAEAVTLAARAGQWTTVEVLSRELAARRLARVSPDVPTLDAERAKRERER